MHERWRRSAFQRTTRIVADDRRSGTGARSHLSGSLVRIRSRVVLRRRIGIRARRLRHRIVRSRMRRMLGHDSLGDSCRMRMRSKARAGDAISNLWWIHSAGLCSHASSDMPRALLTSELAILQRNTHCVHGESRKLGGQRVRGRRTGAYEDAPRAYDKNRHHPIPVNFSLGEYCPVNLAESGDGRE
jgi:hypothetical protein